MNANLAYAKQLDDQDPIAHFRKKFVIDDPDLIYLDGNSLGRMPKASQKLLAELSQQWSERLIRVWGDGHFQVAQHIGAKTSQILGAKPSEVVIAESTSVNLFKLIVGALKRQNGRFKIITDDLNFPSDIYILDGINTLLGNNHSIEVVQSADGIHGPVDEIIAQIDENTALVTLSHTVFKSAYTYDMAAINSAAHEAGALVLWDLSHAAGSVAVDLNGTNADLAVGCTYKYINGGPGAPAFLYVREDLQAQLQNPITGWMSQKNQFDFDFAYKPLPGMDRFLTGTPTVLSMAPIEVGVDLLLEAGMENVREKSVRQSEFLLDLYETKLKPHGFRLNSPADSAWRGSHVSLGHDDGWRITQAMIQEMNIIPDFRAPDNIRLGITPLYTSFEELFTAVSRMEQIMIQKLYEKYGVEKTAVT